MATDWKFKTDQDMERQAMQFLIDEKIFSKEAMRTAALVSIAISLKRIADRQEPPSLLGSVGGNS